MKSKQFKASDLVRAANKLASDLIPGRIFDESAQTTVEIAKRRRIARSTAAGHICNLVRAGKLEQVWKSGPGRPVPAYRIKKK